MRTTFCWKGPINRDGSYNLFKQRKQENAQLSDASVSRNTPPLELEACTILTSVRINQELTLEGHIETDAFPYCKSPFSLRVLIA